jgi:ribosomal protein L3
MEILKGIKVNMSQVFLDNGKVIPVTIVEVENDITVELMNKDVVVGGAIYDVATGKITPVEC